MIIILPLLALLTSSASAIETKAKDLNALLDKGRQVLNETYTPVYTDKRGFPFYSLHWPSDPIGDEEFTQYPNQLSGLLLKVDRGGSVTAPASGIIKYIGPMGKNPSVIIVDHRQQVQTIFVGIDKVSARLGQSVYAGQKLGSVPSYGPRVQKVYFELRHKGKAIDPLPYLKAKR